MGNLVNPVSMRLGNTIYWNSLWVSYQNNSYSYLLSSDFLLYNYLNWYSNSRYFNKFGWVFFLSHYKIIRFLNKIIVIFFLKDYKFYKFMFEFWSLISKFLKLYKKKQYNNLDLITTSSFYFKRNRKNLRFNYFCWYCSFFLFYKQKYQSYFSKYLLLPNYNCFQTTFSIAKKYNIFVYFFVILFLYFRSMRAFKKFNKKRYFRQYNSALVSSFFFILFKYFIFFKYNVNVSTFFIKNKVKTKFFLIKKFNVYFIFNSFKLKYLLKKCSTKFNKLSLKSNVKNKFKIFQKKVYRFNLIYKAYHYFKKKIFLYLFFIKLLFLEKKKNKILNNPLFIK